MVVLVGVTLVALSIVLPRLLDTPAFRARLAAESERELGAALRYARLGIRLLPPAVVLYDAELSGTGLVLRAARADLFVDVPALLRGERDADVVSAVEVADGRARIALPHGVPGATLDVSALGGRAESGHGVEAHASLAPRGTVELQTRTAEGPFETSLEATIRDADAALLAAWLAAVSLGGDARETMRVSAGRLDGTIELSGAMVPTERAYAELTLSSVDAAYDDVRLQGDVRLTIDVGGLRATPGGVFRLDAQAAEVVRGPLRKPAGQPLVVTGALSARADGAAGFVIERVYAAPVALQLDRSAGAPVQLHIGTPVATPPAAPTPETLP